MTVQEGILRVVFYWKVQHWKDWGQPCGQCVSRQWQPGIEQIAQDFAMRLTSEREVRLVRTLRTRNDKGRQHKNKDLGLLLEELIYGVLDDHFEFFSIKFVRYPHLIKLNS